MATNDMLLEVKNVSVDYAVANGTVHAVSNVSLTLRRGEILGLAGESGCGKSTLAFAIARLLRPPAMTTSGSVLYYPGAWTEEQIARKRGGKNTQLTDPADIFQLSPAQLRTFRWNELSIVFQSAMNSLNPVMNVGTQIMDVLQTHRPEMGAGSRKKRAVELLELVGIAPDCLRRYPHELSGGMRQRVAIAMAMALKPELIIMDEPTTALDVVVQREILELIKSLCKEFLMALIFITHDLSLLLELANKVAVMYAGKMVEIASSKDLYLHPRQPYSYGLLNSFPSLHGPWRKMVGILGSPPDLHKMPSGCAFHERCPFAFSPCTTEVPDLCSMTTESPDQLVACHLYNLHYTTTIPSASMFAEGYEALAEGSTR